MNQNRYYKIIIPVEKNNQRGLRQGSAGVCTIPPECPSVRMIFKYLSMRPVGSVNHFYLQVNTKEQIKKGHWYKQGRLGKSKLESIIKNASGALGFVGNFRAHSIRSTAITQLYEGILSIK
jgi:hypothetical protein